MSSKKLEISSIDVFRLFEKKKRRANIADKALKNIIIPFPGFDSTIFDKGYWKVLKKEKYGNSYTLYIHTLRVAAELLLAHEATNEIIYFDKAEEIIQSWIQHSKTDDNNKMIWYDHTTANRTQVLIHYLYLADKLDRKLNDSLFKELLIKHANVMRDDKIYKHNNHGLMMDRSLIILGYILKDESLLIKGKTRAINTFWYSFSSQGIHLENSPQYHSMVVRMYTEIEKYLNIREDSLGDHVPHYLKLSKDYIPAITKPNKRQPSIGDSGDAKQSIAKVYKNIYDFEAGISVMQYEKPYPFYTTFIAGYSSKVHKHKDDLSITLNYKLVDFLVDPGKYSYTANKTRRYIISKEAHSGFYLNQFDYTIKNQNRFDRRIRLDGHVDNHSYTMVKGLHGDFNGSSAKLSRMVIQLKKYPVLLLIDCVNTNVKHQLKFEQNFNLASNVEIKNTDNGYKLIADGEEMVLKQYISTDKSTVIAGDKNKPIAVNTTGFAQVENTKQIKFNKATNQKNVFITGIFDEREVGDIGISISKKTLEILVSNEKIFVYL